MTRTQYDDLWHHADRVRALLARWAEAAPELFPAGFDQGYSLHLCTASGVSRASSPV